MDTQNDINNTPDSWDQNDDGIGSDSVADTTKALSQLNVNAAPFIPGQNPFAKEFVPSFGIQADEEGTKIDLSNCLSYFYFILCDLGFPLLWCLLRIVWDQLRNTNMATAIDRHAGSVEIR